MSDFEKELIKAVSDKVADSPSLLRHIASKLCDDSDMLKHVLNKIDEDKLAKMIAREYYEQASKYKVSKGYDYASYLLRESNNKAVDIIAEEIAKSVETV